MLRNAVVCAASASGGAAGRATHTHTVEWDGRGERILIFCCPHVKNTHTSDTTLATELKTIPHVSLHSSPPLCCSPAQKKAATAHSLVIITLSHFVTDGLMMMLLTCDTVAPHKFCN